MTEPLRIDVVSDVVCPWCAIGVNGLERALERLEGEIAAEIRFRPFELDPAMPPEGRNGMELLRQKFGMTAEQIVASRETLRGRGAEVGFTFTFGDDRRVYNSFDAHRLLDWAHAAGGQRALKQALFRAFFTQGRDISDRDELVAIATEAGLDGDAARDVIESGRNGNEVRQDEGLWRARGINSVPTFIINDRYAISGGQPVDVFIEALRQVAAQA